MKNVLVKCMSCTLICILFACHDQDEINEDTTSYTWTTSSISPSNEFTVFEFKKGDDGQLYFSGWTADEKSILAKLVGNQWGILARVDEMVLGDFAVFQDTVYYSTSLAVKRAGARTLTRC